MQEQCKHVIHNTLCSDGESVLNPNWHIWVVGIATLLWNSMGAFDFTMTQMGNTHYLEQFTKEQLAYFSSFPIWVVIAWGLAVYTSVIGSVLILFKSTWAAPILGISFGSMCITAVHNFLLADTKLNEIAGNEAIYFSIAIFVVALLLWIYAGRMTKTGKFT